jgi:hypothetical protein
MSLRKSGSPPVRIRIGRENEAIWSMRPKQVSVERSSGDESSVAVARQWTQRRLQPRVVSQKMSRGRRSADAGGMFDGIVMATEC